MKQITCSGPFRWTGASVPCRPSGVRAVEHLRLVCGEIKIADVRTQVMLSLFTDFENFSQFKPEERHLPILNTMFDEVVGWGTALKRFRDGQ